MSLPLALAAARPSLTDGTGVVVKTIHPDAVEARLLELSLETGAMLKRRSGESIHVPIADIVHITTAAPQARHAPRDLTLTLARGDILHGTIEGAGNDVVVLETLDLGRVDVPLDAIERIETPLARSDAYRSSVAWFHREPPSEGDRILLTNGDRIGGLVTAIDGSGLSIESDLGASLLPYRWVVAAQLNAAPCGKIGRPYAQIHLRSSGRVTATELQWSGDVVEVLLVHGSRALIEARRIGRVDVLGGRWEWLADHFPISYEHTPMLSMDWGYALNRNVLHRAITVAGETYEHGIGVHSRSVLAYDLRGAYRHFVTHFGIDDDSGPLADVTVLIRVDGTWRHTQAGVRRGALFGPLRLDIAGAKHMELIVEFGENGDVQDRFDWIEPALVR